jgi:hypothetical protein
MRTQIKARGGDHKHDLAEIMKLVIALVFTATVALLNVTAQPQPQPVDVHLSEKASAQAQPEPKPEPVKETPAPTVKPFDAADPSTWPKCADGEIVRADNGKCAKPATPAAAPSTARVAPSGAVSGTGVGDCAAEIAKYNWNINVATAVARAESGLNPGALNNNPSTGDYSVGCFQINLYGANARTRPSEAALKNAATNVEFAYRIYTGNGSSFIGQWGVCRSKVSCY